MFRNKFLSLSGYAYLYDIRCCQKSERLITLNLVNNCSEPCPDDIWIECNLDMRNFPVIARLEHLLALEKTIIVKFDASYSGFQQSYHGQSATDPEVIVQLKGKLLNIHEYFVEKDITPDWHSYGLENDMVTRELGA
ncbi:MAG: hypothetical protein ABI597_12660 [Gammaproteobacteria bacterium]